MRLEFRDAAVVLGECLLLWRRRPGDCDKLSLSMYRGKHLR